MATVYFSGYVFQDDGDAVNGATVELLQVSDGAQEAETTTTGSGFWSFDETDEDRYDIKITSGTSIRYRKWADEISVKAIDVRNNEGEATPAAVISNIANGDDMEVAHFRGLRGTGAADDNLFFRYYMDDGGSNITEVARMTVNLVDATHNSEDAKIVWSVIGNASLLNVFEISSTGLTVGVDDTGYDVKFFGATTGTYMLWDQDTDDLVLTLGAELYFYDAAGGEHIKSDGTDMTIYAGTDLVLSVGADVNIPTDKGLTFGDDGQKIESDGTDFTIASGAKLNLTPTSDVHFANGTGVVVGHTAQETISIDGSTDLVPEFQILGTGAVDSSIMLASFSTTATIAGSPILGFVKGGNATIGSHTVVTDGEELGNIVAYGDDGTDLEAIAAQIQFEVDGTPGTGDMPGRIVFATTVDGAEVTTEAMRIDSSQNVTFAKGIVVTAAASAADDGIANTTGTGLVATMRALTGIAVGELVHIDANGDLDEAHADATLDMPAIGIALTANSSGSDANIQVLLQGFYRDDSQFSFSTMGAAVYVDHSTEGDFTQSPSSTDGHFIQRVGIAVTDDMIYFNPSLDVIERD